VLFVKKNLNGINIKKKHYTIKKNDINIFLRFIHFRNLKLIFLFLYFNHIMNNNSQQSTNKKKNSLNDKNKNIFKIDCSIETNKTPENMSICYNQEISNLEFANELGETNMEEIEKQLKQLMAQKKYILDMKQTNKLSLSVLYQKRQQENINIKFLPFLPKEVNSLIRDKLDICKYETLDNIYENMIKDWIHYECYEDKMKFIGSQIGDQISKDYNREINRGWALQRMYWVGEETKLELNEDTKQFNYEVLKDYKFDEENKQQQAKKILMGMHTPGSFGTISQRVIDPRGMCEGSEMRRFINDNALEGNEYSLRTHFGDWNKTHMAIYLMKNIDKILKYWIEVEMEYLALLNKVLKKLKAFYAITDKTKYWTKMYSGEYDKEELMNKIYYSGRIGTDWCGDETNECDKNSREKIEKYCEAFIDKNKIPVINKNGKLTNKTNYSIMGYDIVKYLEHNTLAKRFDETMFDFSHYDKFMCKWHYDYKYYGKIFIQYYLNKSCSFQKHLDSNNIDFDYAEMRKYIEIGYSRNNRSGEGEEYERYEKYYLSLRDNYFTRSLYDYSEHLFRRFDRGMSENMDKALLVINEYLGK